jgi:hypothetical protein
MKSVSGHTGKAVGLTNSETSVRELRMSDAESDSFVFRHYMDDSVDDIFAFLE